MNVEQTAMYVEQTKKGQHHVGYLNQQYFHYALG